MGTRRYLGESLRALRAVAANRRLRSLQIAGAGSTLGTWAYAVGLPVYAYHAGGARAVGLIFFARFALAAIFSPWLALLADRWSRRQVMLTADLLRVGLLGGMAAIAFLHGPALPVFVLAVSSTIVSSTFPPAQSALLPSLVESPEELTSANVVMSTVGSVGMFAGPALGGILLAASGPAAVFAADASCFVWSALFVMRVPRDARPTRTEHTPVTEELTAGFRAVARAPGLRVVVALTAVQTFTFGALEVLLVVVAIRLLDAGNAGLGWLNTTMGVGGVLGGAAVAVLAARKRLAADFGAGVLLAGAALVLLALHESLAVALVLVAAVGLGATVVETLGTTLLQRSADDEVLGRVFGVLESVVFASLALGSIVAPGLVAALGPRAAIVATGSLLPVLLVPAWPRLRRIDETARIAAEPLALLRAIPIFAPLPAAALERLAGRATPVVMPAGQAVFSRGERGDRFYAIASGSATVELEDGATRTLGPGDFFGEIALLRHVPRTATVRAAEELRLYSLERDDFLGVVTGHAPSLEAAEQVAAARAPLTALG